MDHGVGVGLRGVDAGRPPPPPARRRQPPAVIRLDGGEAKPAIPIARRDESDPARAKHADAVVKDDVVIGPLVCHPFSYHRLSSVIKATSIKTIAGPVLTSAPSGSLHRSGVNNAEPIM